MCIEEEVKKKNQPWNECFFVLLALLLSAKLLHLICPFRKPVDCPTSSYPLKRNHDENQNLRRARIISKHCCPFNIRINYPYRNGVNRRKMWIREHKEDKKALEEEICEESRHRNSQKIILYWIRGNITVLFWEFGENTRKIIVALLECKKSNAVFQLKNSLAHDLP